MANIAITKVAQSIPASNEGLIAECTESISYGFGLNEPTEWISTSPSETITYDGSKGLMWVKIFDSSRTPYLSYFINDSYPTVQSSGAVKQHVNDVTPFTISNYYSSSLATGDFMNFARSSNGQQFAEISMNPLSVGDEQTMVEYKTPFRFPCYSEIEASMSQRVRGQYAVMEITDKDSSYLDEPIEYTFTSLSQSITTLVAVLNAPFDGYLGSWVDIYGLVDNRFNYTNLNVATISSDKKTLTFTVCDEATITSLTATASNLTGGKLKRQAKLLLAANALGIRYAGTSATSCAYLSRFGGGSIKESGTLGGSKLALCGTTAPTYISGLTGQVELKAPTRFRIEAEPEVIVFGDRASDVLGNLTLRSQFTAVKPIGNANYYVRFRAVTPKSIARPVAKIVKAEKLTATATATIYTDVPHGLTTASYVTIKGISNQTVFANLTTPTVVASVIDATTFTIICGTATIATSYSGAVILCNGNIDQQGIIAQVPQSIARDANGLVTIVGNGTWTGLGGVGEYVNLYGIRDSATGADLGFDGVYKVHNFATTTLILEPVTDLMGSIVLNGSGIRVTPTGGVTANNCGGAVILRTTLRNHDIVLATYTQNITKIMGQGSFRADMALPVVHMGVVSANTFETTLVNPSIYTLTTAASTNAASVKSTAGTVYSITASNVTATAMYLKIYNKASAPTVGTDVPLITIPVPANSFVTFELGRVGTRFATGIATSVTGVITTADTTVAPALGLITISYI